MDWLDREKQELIQDEGRTNKSYKDIYGNWTIGVGHFLGPNPIYKNVVWDDATVDQIFLTDVEDAVDAARVAYPSLDTLDGPRRGALVNMAFQLGAPKLSGFHTFLRLLKEQKYDEAAQDLMDNTAYARQVPARASRIAYRIRTGQYSNDR